VVRASEVNAPEGVKPVQWRLLTNRPVDSVEQAAELIDRYRARWEIEILFNTFKNGYRIEQLQLNSFDKLQQAIALHLVVSVAHWLPDAPEPRRAHARDGSQRSVLPAGVPTGLCTAPQEATGQAEAQRSRAPDRDARRLHRAQGQRRARRQDAVAA
jgi:hypothetical protein